MNLTGAALAVHVRQPSGAVLTLTGTQDGTDGAWVASWPGTIQQPGEHVIEVQVTFSGGAVQTFGPATVYVEPQLA